MKKMVMSVAALLTLAACQTTSMQEQAVTNTNMAPAERLILSAGDVSEFKRLRNGEEIVSTVSVAKPGVYDWKVSNGCYGTSMASDPFAPTLSWNKCGDSPRWHTGTNTITNKTGELWPLKVGNTVSYSYTSKSHMGRTSDNMMNCEVEKTANIMAAGKAYDTYKVVCNDRWNRRTYYYAPSERITVWTERYRKNRNTSEVTEFVTRL